MVNYRTFHSATEFAVSIKKTKISFLRYIGCLNFTKDHTKHGLLQIQALVPHITELSKLLTSCLTAIRKHVIKYCDKVCERSGKNLF